MIGIIVDLLIAAFVGWCTGKIMGYSKGTLVNIIIGLIGGVIGSILIGLLGTQPNGSLGSLLVSIVGACVLVFAYRKITK